MKKGKLVMFVHGIDVDEQDFELPLWYNSKTVSWNYANLRGAIEKKKDEMLASYKKASRITQEVERKIEFQVTLPSKMNFQDEYKEKKLQVF